MKTTKVIVKDSINSCLAEILPVGFETELIPRYTDKDKVIFNETVENGKVTNPEIIAPAGTFDGFTFMGANGNIYGDYIIKNMVGYVSLDKIFDKLS